MKEFWDIDELSQYLGIKKSSLYSKVERKEIPHYKIGNLLRFKKSDIDTWMDGLKCGPANHQSSARRMVRTSSKARADINAIITKSIAQAGGLNYTSYYGKPDRARGHRKEVNEHEPL